MTIPAATLDLIKKGIRLIFDSYNASTDKEHFKTALFNDIWAAHESLETSASVYAKAMETLNNAKERAALSEEIKTLPFWVEKEKEAYNNWCAFMNRNGDIPSDLFNDPSFNSDNTRYLLANRTFEKYRTDYEEANLKVVQLRQLMNDPRLKGPATTIESASSKVDSIVSQFWEQMQDSITTERVAQEFLERSFVILQTG